MIFSFLDVVMIQPTSAMAMLGAPEGAATKLSFTTA
jgi:hypothetical protein